MVALSDAAESWVTPLTSTKPWSSFGAVRTLKLLLIGSIVIPLVAATAGGYLSYQAHYERAGAALAEAASVVEQNTTKVLDTHVLVAARIGDLLSGLSDDEIRTQEKQLSSRMAQQVAGLPQVAAAWVIGADGRALVSARVYPVNTDIDHSARDDFRALKDDNISTYIWALRAKSLQTGEYQPYFTVSRRREGSDGRFLGIVVVAVSGDYLASFYTSLLGTSTQYVASVLRDDGSVLAQYPDTDASPFQGQQNASIANGVSSLLDGGLAAKGTLLDAHSIVAYRRLASYPVYVALGRSQASVDHEWFAATVGYAVIGFPAAFGFVFLCLLALRRTLSEQAALRTARNAMAQRAAVEAELTKAETARALELSAKNGELTHTIQELKIARSKAEAASKAKSEFLAHMSHELRTPLNAVIGFSDVIRGEVLGPIGTKAYADYASDIHFSGTHLLNIINGILDLLRHESGKIELHEEYVDLDQAVSEAIKLVQLQAAEASVRIVSEEAAYPIQISCDRVRLRQILLNILSNSIKFTEPGGTVDISVESSDGIMILVKDNGIGISVDDLNRITTPFTQIGSVYARNHQGAGLGLSLTKALMECHGGRLTVESELGAGTSVCLWFPAQRLIAGFSSLEFATGRDQPLVGGCQAG